MGRLCQTDINSNRRSSNSYQKAQPWLNDVFYPFLSFIKRGYQNSLFRGFPQGLSAMMHMKL